MRKTQASRQSWRRSSEPCDKLSTFSERRRARTFNEQRIETERQAKKIGHMTGLRYEPIGHQPQDKILSTVFDAKAKHAERSGLIYSAAYFQTEEFFVEFARRGFEELEPPLQFILIDAIDSYMQSRDTISGIDRLLPSIHHFAAQYSEEDFPGITLTVEGILELFARAS